MEKLSNVRTRDSFKSAKEQVINFACSQTGLSEKTVSKIYENQKALLVPDNEIKSYFENLVKPKTSVNANDLRTVIADIFSEVDSDKKDEMIGKFIEMLNDVSNPENEIYIDSVNLISLIKDIIISIKPEAKEKLDSVISVSELNDNDFKVLNESFNFNNFNETDNEKSVALFESLGNILSKNNRRWGNSVTLGSSYEQIMNYIKETTENIQLNNEIFSIDRINEIELINQFLNGNINPILKDFSSAKTQIRDTQTLILDIVLVISKFVHSREEDLSFVSRDKVVNFESAITNLIPLLYSSVKESKLLSDEFKRQFFINNKQVIGKDNLVFGDGEIHYQMMLNTDLGKLSHINSNVYNLSIKGIQDLINFVASASFDFNLKMRPLIKNFVNSSRTLVDKVGTARIMKAKYDGNIIK